ncbi:hypothetical protein [Anaplasma phagocytophilum]|uniref:hypothetical protein n=1 Tax=Anaplasma phagocytophilum TaxID=948 RepID=UPI00201B05F1
MFTLLRLLKSLTLSSMARFVGRRRGKRGRTATVYMRIRLMLTAQLLITIRRCAVDKGRLMRAIRIVPKLMSLKISSEKL